MRASCSEKMVPLAPARFSTSTGFPQRGCNSNANCRARMSVVPPGGKGPTILAAGGGGLGGGEGEGGCGGGGRGSLARSPGRRRPPPGTGRARCPCPSCPSVRACSSLFPRAQAILGPWEFDHRLANGDDLAALVSYLHIERQPASGGAVFAARDDRCRADGVARLDGQLPTGFKPPLYAAMRI